MNTKKWLALLLSCVMLFALAACGAAPETAEEPAAAAEEPAEAPEAETEEAVSEAKEAALAAVEELRALLPDTEKMEARFDEIMKADTQDPGLASFPDGYTFTTGTMMTEFEEAAMSMQEYEISDPVETATGYHVILRLPLRPEDLTMKQDSTNGGYMSLRQLAATSMFTADLLAWLENVEVKWEPGFEDLDLNELFGIDPEADPGADAELPQEERQQAAYDALAEAAKAYKPGTKVLSVNGVPVTWNVYYAILTEDLQDYVYYMSSLPDDMNMTLTEDQTYTQYLKSMALSKAEYYVSGGILMKDNNLTFTAEQEQELKDYWDGMVEQYNGEEELLKLLQDYCMDKDAFMYFMRANEEISTVMNSIYGAAGENLTEEEIVSWGNENNYVRTKHILYMDTADTDETAE